MASPPKPVSHELGSIEAHGLLQKVLLEGRWWSFRVYLWCDTNGWEKVCGNALNPRNLGFRV